MQLLVERPGKISVDARGEKTFLEINSSCEMSSHDIQYRGVLNTCRNDCTARQDLNSATANMHRIASTDGDHVTVIINSLQYKINENKTKRSKSFQI